MAQTFTKNKLSWNTNWKNLKVTGTTTWTSITVHTAVSGTTNFDEVYIYADNTSASAVTLTIEFWGTTSPDDLIVTSIPANSWPMLIVPWLLLQNWLLVKAFAWSANVITINWYVHNIVNT